jgi:hypothetical protein
MSFKALRPPRNCSYLPSKRPSTSLSQDATLRHHHLVPPSAVPKMCHGYRTKESVWYRNNEVLAEPLGCVFVRQQLAHPQTSWSTAISLLEPALDDPFMDTRDAEALLVYMLMGGEDPELRRQHQQWKKEQQWAKWTDETIPLLLRPYLQILHESDNLRHLNRHSNIPLPACLCERWASINVTCVFFECKSFYLK